MKVRHISKSLIAGSPQTFYVEHTEYLLTANQRQQVVYLETHKTNVIKYKRVYIKNPSISTGRHSTFGNKLQFCGQTKNMDAEGWQVLFPGWIPCMCSHHLLFHTACVIWEAPRIRSAVTAMNLHFQSVFFVYFHAFFWGTKKWTKNKKEQATYVFRRILHTGTHFVSKLTSCKLNFPFKS